MAETELTKPADNAEKAYAEAAAKVEAGAEKPAVKAEVMAEPTPVAAPVVADVTLPVLKRAPVAKKPAAAKLAKAPVAKKAPVKKARKAPVAKAAAVKAPAKVAKPRRKAVAKPIIVKSAAPKAAKSKPRAIKPVSNLSVTQLKEKIMATKKTTTDFADNIKTVVADAQGKAKVAFEKGQAAFGEASEFTKGNVEALVESTKILGSGLQELTSGYVAESKSAFETLTADVKALAAVQSPTDFFKLQGEIARRNFDKAVTFGSKNSEAVLKLTNDVVAPISGRVSLAVEKVKKAA